MSTTTAADVSSASSTSATQARLMSLDLFRGATIAAMILVNNPGNEQAAYWPLQHSVWNGWTPTDLIFPFFLFIVGVSIVLSFESRLRRGESKRALMLHSVRRGMTLFAIGLFLNVFPSLHFATWRIPGVLQRIGLCYIAAAAITLYFQKMGRLIWIAALLIGYWLVMRFVPVPGFGVPGRDIPLLDPDNNLAAWLDRLVIPGRFYEVTRDPEGILSTFPAIGTVLLGVLTREWLRSPRTPQQKARGMALSGLALAVAGELWGIWFPINKKLWTSSFVLLTAGLALLVLALCYWATDIRRHRCVWTRPFVIFGMNAIAVYVFAELLAHALGRITVGRANLQDFVFLHSFSHVGSPAFASLLYSLAYVAVCFLPAWWMYRKKIFLKV